MSLTAKVNEFKTQTHRDWALISMGLYLTIIQIVTN